MSRFVSCNVGRQRVASFSFVFGPVVDREFQVLEFVGYSQVIGESP